MDKYESFSKLMQEYIELLDKLLELEQNKIRIIAAGSAEGINECMRKEEAEMLRMRGLDRKRENLLKEIGLEGKTFREIVELQAAGQNSELQLLYNKMQEKTALMKKLSASISSMLESRLISIEKTISASEGMGNSYGRDGRRKDMGTAPRMKPTSV